MDLKFIKAAHAELLEAELIAAGLAKPGRFAGVSAGQNKDGDPEVTVHAADDVTDEEKDAITAVVVQHSEAAAVRAARLEELGEDCRKYIYVHYRPEQQQTISILLTEALAKNYTTRAAYIQSGLDWVKGVLGYYYSTSDALQAATSKEEVEAVSWDFAASFDATDPQVAIRTAAGITN